MKVLVTGGRYFSDRAMVERMFKHLEYFVPSQDMVLIHGGASGADKLADEVASERGWRTIVYHARWNTEGRAAGPRRNQRMVDAKPDVAVAFPGGKGTADCVRRVKRAGISLLFGDHLT